MKWEPPNAWKMCPHDKGKTVSVPKCLHDDEVEIAQKVTRGRCAVLSVGDLLLFDGSCEKKKKERRHERRPFCKFVEPGLAELRAPPPYRYHTHNTPPSLL